MLTYLICKALKSYIFVKFLKSNFLSLLFRNSLFGHVLTLNFVIL